MLASSPGDAEWAVAYGTPGRDLVLIVEDNEFVARLMSCLVERGALRALCVRSGAEAERWVRDRGSEIALVVLDCRLPDADGPALARALQREHTGLPVLLTSGQGYSGPRASSGGPSAFLAKPFHPADFYRALGHLAGATA